MIFNQKLEDVFISMKSALPAMILKIANPWKFMHLLLKLSCKFRKYFKQLHATKIEH